jgi:2-amino-4-hydroxy-6-hydroxymethyldihydropteridine diphosphokinase/dihydroneopterin aldolase
MQVDLTGAAESDRLAETVDYGAVLTAVEEVVAKSRDLLLERLAGRIAETVLGWTAVETVEVAVRKLRPSVSVLIHDTGVRLVRSQAGRSASTSAGPHRALVALGSNLGDRAGYLRHAVSRLAPVVQSSVWETDPVGGPSGQGPYLNMVIAVETADDPFAFMRRCQRVEITAGRVRRTHHGARTLDVDILFYDDIRIESPELVVPHPRLTGRAFVLAPLAEIAPTRVPLGWADDPSAMAGLRSLGRLDLL